MSKKTVNETNIKRPTTAYNLLDKINDKIQ